MAAHLPMLLQPETKDILVVGIGAGQAPGRFLYYDIRSLDCIDYDRAGLRCCGKTEKMQRIYFSDIPARKNIF